MIVRPTLEVLKVLEKKDMLPLETTRALQHARKVDDRTAQLALLVVLDLSFLDVSLLQDARAGFANGTPDRQYEMSRKAGSPVYEVRDKGTGWRGAVVQPDDDGCAWLILVDAHDRFHAAGPDTIKAKARNGTLGPSSLDRRIRDKEHEERTLAADRASLLESLIDALIVSARTTERETVPTMGAFAQVELAVQVNEPAAPDWDPTAAHEEVSGLIVSLSLASTTKNVQEEAIRTCVPFLQPDTSMWESIYRNELTIDVLVTRAGLMQLLATDRPLLPVEDRPASAPLTLHYTAKRSLAHAFVYGHAVRAVCGQWWVPVGGGKTHAELPICADCEREEPFAQSAWDILEPRT